MRDALRQPRLRPPAPRSSARSSRHRAVAARPDYAVVHYQRPAGDYDGWGLHFWGDIDQTSGRGRAPSRSPARTTTAPSPGSSSLPNAAERRVHRPQGRHEGPGAGPLLRPVADPGDLAQAGRPDDLHVSAAAQGFVESATTGRTATTPAGASTCGATRSTRARATTWEAPQPPTVIDDYGAYWTVPLARRRRSRSTSSSTRATRRTPGRSDRSFVPTEQPAVWLQSGDATIYETRGAAEDFAIIHYHRPDGDYGDPSSPELQRLLGHAHVGRAPRPGPGWTAPLKPAGTDRFGPFSRSTSSTARPRSPTSSTAATPRIRARTSSSTSSTSGTRSGTCPGTPTPTRGEVPAADPGRRSGVDANLAQQKAHWLTRDTIAWNIEPLPGGEYALHYAPDGGLAVDGGAITGGETIPLAPRRERPPRRAEGEVAAPRRLPAFRIAAGDLDAVPGGAERPARGLRDRRGRPCAIATGVQIPGVLDDLYANDGDLGVDLGRRRPDAPAVGADGQVGHAAPLRGRHDGTSTTPP